MATLSPSGLLRVSLMLALLLSQASADADESISPEPSRDEYARELYLRAESAYQEGNYNQAISALTRAYELSPRPALLYNLANAFERLGRYEEAASKLERYAAEAPEQQRETVRKRIASLEARAAERRRMESAATQRLASSPREGDMLDSQNVRVSRTERAPGRSPLGFLVAGTGIASIGLGAVFGISARNARGDARELCMPGGESVLCPVRTRKLLVQASHSALAANVAWGAGAAAVGAGLYLLLGSNANDAQASTVRITPLSRGAELNVAHAF
jgi:tetratricopeptide (TPR) repeat protein